MCGIVGKIYFEKNRNVSLEELKKMANPIEYRGPDDEGYYMNRNVGLGFRRLSIIDLKTGHQPLSNSEKTSWITFNGEIYNFKELRVDLKKDGYIFKTDSDTEVIINLYQKHGEKCVDYLRGMFAFVIWDERQQKLFGARDRFGIKPFYYYLDGEKFVWGSEMKSILANEKIRKNIHLESLDYYFAYGYTPRKESIFCEIKKLEPGNSFVFSYSEKEKLKIKTYWKTHYTPDYSKTELFWKEAIYESLNEAVKMRMISDVPLGAFLSGGIDSSIVVALMSLNSNKAIKTFSIGFKEEKYNELKYARILANRYETEHHEFIVEPQSVELLPNLVRAFDEPFADSSAIPTYYVSKYTREHVTVALSGDGGDELFAGYDSYDKMMMLYRKKHYPRTLFAWANKLIPDHIFGKGITYYLSKNKNNIGAYFCLWKDYERRKIFLPEIINRFNKNYSEESKISILKTVEGDFLTKMQQLDIQTYMVDDILTKVDRTSMMNSLEARVPILDHKFAELSFSIPSKFKLKENIKKYILKETFSKILPPEIISHKKQGFAVPLSKWFKGSLKDYANDSLRSSNKLYHFLDKKQVEKILDNHQKGMRDYSSKIWTLLILNEWLSQNT